MQCQIRLNGLFWIIFKGINMEYQFTKSVTLSQIETRIVDCYSMARICHYTSEQFTADLMEKVIKPLAYRTPSGRAKHSAYVQGYAAGIIARIRSEIWQQHVEFCYLVDGELYSTWKKSARKTTDHFYDTKTYAVFHDAPSGHYWIGTDKPY